MSILVIGASGQLALSLAEAAAARGLAFAALGRPQLDLLEPSSVEHAIDDAQPTLVINAAAYTAVDRAESEPDLAFAINANAVEHLGRACARHGIGVVHLSTDYVFDGRKAGAYVEGDPVAPLGVYGRSKLAGEERLRAVNDRHVILRTAWVYSPFGHNFLKTMLRLGAERPRLSVVDDQRGNPTYAPHLASVMLGIAARIGLTAGEGCWGTYHAAGSGETTWFGFAHEIFAQAHMRGLKTPELAPITTDEYPTPAARPANSQLDCRLLEARFGLTLPDWRSGIADCLDRLLVDS